MNATTPQQLQIKISDEMARGVYANMMAVNHSREAFTLDFISLLPPGAQVVARVVTNPAHFKQIVAALQENLQRYETAFGAVQTGEPQPAEFGFKVTEKNA